MKIRVIWIGNFICILPSSSLLVLFWRFVLWFRGCYWEWKSVVHIGAVLDVNSPFGSMAELCMTMAISDFYKAHPDYTTRLKLQIKNATNLLDANIAALQFLSDEQVHVVLGPKDETENVFITQLGEQVSVPVVSFTARSSSSAFKDNHYFVRAAPDDALQAQAIAAIFQGFEWPEVVVLYEDTDYGNQFLSHVNKAFQDVEVGIASMIAFPATAEDSYMSKELEKLTAKETRVFLVHMRPSLGYKLFTLAKSAGVLMSEGYAWIISDSLSNSMNSMPYVARDAMEGVLGVRPYNQHSKELEDFQERYKRNMLGKSEDSKTELNVYGLWAYDAITAVMIAAENVGPINSSPSNVNKAKNATCYTKLRTSEIGPRLLKTLSVTKFQGLAGDFQLVDRKLKQSAFEIINVYGSGERTVGFWTPGEGIVRQLSSNAERTYSTSVEELKTIIWPGDTTTRPDGQAIQTARFIRVGIPWKLGFKEFVSAEVNLTTNQTNANGFAIDIFLAARAILPFNIDYRFEIYNDTKNKDWSFDAMLHQIPQNFDMVVADTTIRAPRTEYIEFSLPYTESGVVLVVKNRKPFDMWIFTKPLRWDLWLAIFVACICMGTVLRVMEHQVTRTSEDLTIIRAQRERLGMIYWSPVAILAFPESNMVANKWSFFVLVFWMFMAFILMQSYTANLSAILTVDQLKFAFSDNYYVGCQEGSFMKAFLTERLHISESRLKIYASAEEYHDAMSKGSKHGGIDAIFDEIPYMKIFLNKYDSEYKMVGPTYKTGGFGFAFPIGSILTANFSKAILDVTQGPNITAIEQKNFGPGYSSQDPLSSTISQGTSSLTLYEFAGLFLIVGSVTLFALFCSSTRIGRNLTGHVEHLVQFCACFKTPAVDPIDSCASTPSVEGPEEHANPSVQSIIGADVIEGPEEHVNPSVQTIIGADVIAVNPIDASASTPSVEGPEEQVNPSVQSITVADVIAVDPIDASATTASVEGPEEQVNPSVQSIYGADAIAVNPIDDSATTPSVKGPEEHVNASVQDITVKLVYKT